MLLKTINDETIILIYNVIKVHAIFWQAYTAGMEDYNDVTVAMIPSV